MKRIRVQPAKGKPFWVKDHKKIKIWEARATEKSMIGFIPTITKREE